jgi:threonine synthase
MTIYSCSDCRKPHPKSFVFRCPKCGGIYKIEGRISFDPVKFEGNQPGIWRYRHSFGLPKNSCIITLGEGNTPLVWAEIFKSSVGMKLEYLNPTGSYKDRLTAPLISYLHSLGVKAAVEDSSGNAGASFAAYAARAGIKARVFIPDYASGPKRDQIKNYGAEIISVMGSRAETSKAILEVVKKEGAIYASHAFLPQGLSGIATISYELHDQINIVPGTIIAPIGHGGLMLGLVLGFEALLSAKVIAEMPTFIGVQAERCAPIWMAYNQKLDELPIIKEMDTIASGIRVSQASRGKNLLELSKIYDLRFVTVEEDRIIPGRDCLAQLGFYVEPTSAVVWDALNQVVGEVPEPVVLVLTGSGLKHIDS